MSTKPKRAVTGQEFAAKRANAPGLYRCMNCGELLSGPAWRYTCPGKPCLAQPRDVIVQARAA